jgi:hypothetical protein
MERAHLAPKLHIPGADYFNVMETIPVTGMSYPVVFL